MKNENAVNVIAVFNSDGKIRPLYVKAEGYDTVKVSRVVSVKDAPFSGSGNVLAFTCRYISENMEKEILLYYNIHAHLWTVPGLSGQK